MLALARPVHIGRREGLPGQKVVELVDALKGEQFVWFRFRVIGGEGKEIARVRYERGDDKQDIRTVMVYPRGGDLHVVVQVPREKVDRDTRLRVDLVGGPHYKFSLSSSTLTNFLRNLF